jgi:hypothetical protein
MKPGMLVHANNPITLAIEVGGSQVGGQPGLQGKTLSLKN